LYWNTLPSRCRKDSGLLVFFGDPASPNFDSILAERLKCAAADPMSDEAFMKEMAAAFVDHNLYDAARPFIDAVNLAAMLDSPFVKSVE